MSYLPKEPSWKLKHKKDPSYDPDNLKPKLISLVSPLPKKGHPDRISYSKTDLIRMNKQEQTDLIKQLDPSKPIPRLEKDRVNLILELLS